MADYPVYDGPQAKLIAKTDNPHEELDYQVQLKADSFSVLDPRTGRPRQASLEISYFPADSCVDQDSLALYLLSFRQERMSVEAAAGRIVKDIAEAVDPHQLRLEARFCSADGIEAKLIVPWPTPDEDEEAGWDTPEE